MPKPIQVMEDKGSSWAARLLAPLTLCEWGAILIYFYYSHRLSSLLHPYFHVLVLVTGFLLLASSACVFWWDGEEEQQSAHECGDARCGHSDAGMSAKRLLAFLVLSVPIALATVVSPDSYGSVMLRNRGVVETVEKVTSGAPAMAKNRDVPPSVTQPEEPAAVEVGDLLLAAQTEAGMARYDGKRVELMGQVFPLGQRKFEIVRMLMLCCAADVQMLAVQVESDHDLQLPDMKWAKVTGRVGFTKKGNRAIPVVTAEKVVSVRRPDDPYVYHGGSLPAKPRGNFELQLPPR